MAVYEKTNAWGTRFIHFEGTIGELIIWLAEQKSDDKKISGSLAMMED